MIQQLITFLSPAIAFLRNSKPKNLKDYLGMKFPYEPVPFSFNNAGSREKPELVKATNQFKPKKHAAKNKN